MRDLWRVVSVILTFGIQGDWHAKMRDLWRVVSVILTFGIQGDWHASLRRMLRVILTFGIQGDWHEKKWQVNDSDLDLWDPRGLAQAIEAQQATLEASDLDLWDPRGLARFTTAATSPASLVILTFGIQGDWHGAISRDPWAWL
jgi:hypothetical protein